MLSISNLCVSFETPQKRVQVVHGVDLELGKAEILGLVGESGSGKSLTCLSIMRLLGPTALLTGQITFKDRDLLALDENAITKVRGREIAIVFQDAMGSLNPVQTLGRQLCEAIRINTDRRNGKFLDGPELRAEAVRLLSEVGIPEPKRRLWEYPHQMSGGMNQRVLIAMMLAGNPSVLIADEPTTALDVTIQAQILRLLRSLRDTRHMSIILITHDLGVVAETCHRVAVMYCGRIVETGTVDGIFHAPRHPYTVGLLNSRPRIDHEAKQLKPIEGVVPSPQDLPSGCAFRPRCPYAQDTCGKSIPMLEFNDDHHGVACFYPVQSRAR